jgi:anti-repressor protein
MYRLLPIQTTALDQEAIPTVNARDLHAFLDVRKAFAAWIQDRIAKFGFFQPCD